MHRKKIGILAALIVVCFLISGFSYVTVVKPHMKENIVVQCVGREGSNLFAVDIRKGKQIVQNIRYSGHLTGIRLSFGTYGQKYDNGNLNLKLIECDSETELQNINIDLSQLEDNQPIDILFTEKVKFSKDKTYQFILSPGEGYKKDTELAIWCYDQNEGAYSTVLFPALFVDTLEVQGCWMLDVCKDYSVILGVHCLITILLIIVILIVFICQIKEVQIYKIFIPVSILLGCVYLFVVPVLGTFDEQVHLENILYHTSLIFEDDIQEDIDNDAEHLSFITRKEYVDYLMILKDWAPSPQKYVKYENLGENCFNAEEKAEFQLTTSILSPSYLYLPQIVGATIAYVFNCNLFTLVFIAALSNLLFYVIIISYSIKQIPFGKEMFFLLAICPSAIKSAASLSYDGFINCLAFLLISYIIKMVYSEKIDRKDLLIAAVIFVVLSPCKLVYIFMGFFFFMLPIRQKAGKGYFKEILCIGLGAALMLVVVQFNNIRSLMNRSQGVVMSPFGEESYSYLDIIRQPKAIIKLFVFTITRDLGDIVAKAFARIQYIEYPLFLIMGLVCCIIMVLFYSKKIIFTRKNKIVSVGTIFIVVSALFTSAIAWTKKTSISLMGVQGRYFIPILPICFLLLKSYMKNSKENASLKNRWILIFLFIEIVGIWVIFDKMIVGNYDSVVSW